MDRLDQMARDDRRDFAALNQRFDTLDTNMQAAYVSFLTPSGLEIRYMNH